MSKSESGEMDLVYGRFRLDELVFMPLGEARDKARLWETLETAVTWGEVRKSVAARFVEELMWLFDGEGLALPKEDEDFTADMIPGYADGDWPSWPAQEMLEWMPAEVQRRCGKRIATIFNGDYLRLPEANESEIVELLQEHGYTCRRSDSLVEAASGWGSYGAAGFDASG